MSPDELHQHLGTARAALRAILHVHLLDPKVREHLESAVAHVSEAGVALRTPAQARDAGTLQHDRDRVAQLLERARQRPQGLHV